MKTLQDYDTACKRSNLAFITARQMVANWMGPLSAALRREKKIRAELESQAREGDSFKLKDIEAIRLRYNPLPPKPEKGAQAEALEV